LKVAQIYPSIVHWSVSQSVLLLSIDDIMAKTEEPNPSPETPSAAKDVKDGSVKPAPPPSGTVDSKSPKAELPSKPDDESITAPATIPSIESSKPIATPESSLSSPPAQMLPKDIITEDNEPSPPPYTKREDEVEPPESERKRVYIAVMGQTGTGKSTFINQVTGAKLEVGHTMGSCMLLHLVKLCIFRHSADRSEQVQKK
jgi:hypothetical protein